MHSENAQVHKIFLYCSGGERSVKCVRPASKEEQTAVVRFLVAESGGTREIHRHMSKRPRMLSDGIIHLHDNARPHPANLVRDKLQKFGWETLQDPPYSSDRSPCDLHIFGDLKKDIRERRFHSDEEMQEWVRLWIRQRPTSFYKTGIDRLVSQWNKCIKLLAITFQ